MGAKIADLRDAVVIYINGEAYSQVFTATAANIPVFELEDTNDIVVTVFPGEFTVDVQTRASWEYRYVMHVIVQKNITEDDRLAEEDEMLLLAEEILDSIGNYSPTGFALIELSVAGGSQQPFFAEQLASAGRFVRILEAVYLG